MSYKRFMWTPAAAFSGSIASHVPSAFTCRNPYLIRGHHLHLPSIIAMAIFVKELVHFLAGMIKHTTLGVNFSYIMLMVVLAREQFAFGEEVLQGIFFGCSYKTKLIDTSGILGLAEHSSSLLTQLGYRRFGYCIGDVTDMSYSYHKLFIGNSVTIMGDKTSLIVDSKYYINVERIEVGGLLLDIDRDIFKKKAHTGGMVVDSGSAYTFMPLVAVKSFETALIKMFTKANFTRNNLHSHKGYQKLCYDGDVKKDLDLQSFPPVKLTFEGGATMDLIAENVFHQVSESSFCLGTIPIEVVDADATISILGFHMQQQFYVSFDLDRKEFAFTRMDCETWS
ncbi:hypothetical protein ACP275_10G148500 [Erythranthe tilingii]